MDTVKVTLPFVDEGVRLAPEQHSGIEGPFLFVNETTSAPAFKLGGRQDIRSHVRKNVARRFRQNHKGEKAARGQRSEQIRYPRLLAQGGSDAASAQYHTQSCAHIQPPYSSISEIEQESSSSNLAAKDLKDQNTSSTSTSAPEIPVGNKQMDIGPIPSGSAHGTVLLPSQIRDHSTRHDDPFTICPTCGSRLYATNVEAGERSGTQLLVRRFDTGSLFNDPVESLGSGRVDPFLSYPMAKPTPKVHELIDHAVTYLLPGLMLDAEDPAVNSLTKAWFSTGLQHPLLFHALAFAGSVHLDFLRTSQIFPNSPHALSHKLAVIHELKEIMNDPEQAQRDEVILSILILSSHEAVHPSQIRSNPFNSPLKKVQWLNIYGNITYVPEHMKAVMELSTMRGGIQKLRLHGLAEIIASGDLTASTQSLSRPALPPLQVSKTWIATVLNWATSPPRLPMPQLGRRFRDLQNYGLTENAINVFDAIAALSLAITHYLDGERGGLSLLALSKGRSAIQHSLLALATAEEMNSWFGTQSNEPNIYEACRLTALIYGVAIVYPIPNSYNALQNLVRSLKTSTEVCQIERLTIVLPDFLLWILVLGGIAAFDKPERTWYATQLARLVKKRGTYNWERVEEELASFLWMDSACGAGGLRLWSEVMETLYILESLDSHE